MWLDILALVLLAIFAALGARRGALATGLSLAGLVVGYLAAILAGRSFGDPAAELFGVSPLFGAPIAGTLAFCFVSFDFFGALLGVAPPSRSRPSRPRVASAARSSALRADRSWCCWSACSSLFVEAMPQFSARDSTTSRVVDTPLQSVTRAAVRVGVETALGDTPGADVAANALSHPPSRSSNCARSPRDPRSTALAEDREFWAYVEADAVPAALAQPSFQRLQWNPDVRGELASLGVVDEIAAGDPALFALEMRGALEQIGPRIQQIRNDPDLAALAADPDVAELVQRRDVVGLLANPAFQQVLSKRSRRPRPDRRERVLSGLPAPGRSLVTAARTDVGATHIALTVSDLDASVAFYARYA